MNKLFTLALAIAFAFGFTASEVQARGGGHGGGHHGGGHHGGGHHGGHHGNHHHHANHHHHHNGHHNVHYAGHHHPFTHGWAGNHTGGWNYGGYGGYNNLWNGAGYGTAAAFLGMSAAAPLAYNYPVNSVLTGDNGTTGQTGQIAQSTQPQTTNFGTQATQLAQTGATDPAKGTNFLPLGVYSIAPEKDKDAVAMVQMSVTKEGTVRGTYYDLENEKEQVIHGAVDKKTQRVAWTVGDNAQPVYETALANLTDNSGPLAVHNKDGQTSRWTMARFDKEPAPIEEKKAEAKDNNSVSDDSLGVETKTLSNF